MSLIQRDGGRESACCKGVSRVRRPTGLIVNDVQRCPARCAGAGAAFDTNVITVAVRNTAIGHDARAVPSHAELATTARTGIGGASASGSSAGPGRSVPTPLS